MITAAELGRRFATGELNPVDVTEQCLERAAAEEAVFIRLTPERARREARASAERLRAGTPLGPLDGVPVTWKDVFDIAGTVTTAGSLTRVASATQDAPGVVNLSNAGMVCIGKTNLTEFAYSGLGINPHFGTPRNPYGSDRIPGGSSSGAAVAVARGVAPVSIGTDTSGSVRIPAAFTGLAGYKSTETRHSRVGMANLSPTLDSVGVLANEVADLIAVDAALRGLAPVDFTAPAPAELTIVVPAGDLTENCADAVHARFEEALSALAAAGVTIVRRPVPSLDEARRLLDQHGTIVEPEGLALHRHLVRSERAGLVDPRIMRRLTGAATHLTEDYLTLLWARPRLAEALAADLAGGVLAYPTVRHTAPSLAALEADDELYVTVNRSTLRSTMLASYLNLPGVALPTGRDEDGLPTSLLLSLPPAADDTVLAAASTVERLIR